MPVSAIEPVDDAQLVPVTTALAVERTPKPTVAVTVLVHPFASFAVM